MSSGQCTRHLIEIDLLDDILLHNNSKIDFDYFDVNDFGHFEVVTSIYLISWHLLI